MTIKIQTKRYRDYNRNLTPTRLLAARFYIWCLEEAMAIKKFPRDYSLFKIELEFQPPRYFGQNKGYIRAPLAARLARIWKSITCGRTSKIEDLAARDAVTRWIESPEIKPLIAERVLTGDV